MNAIGLGVFLHPILTSSQCQRTLDPVILCRIAQKQCCVSTVKENSCLAGMIAAKEGDACGPEESDPCGGSSYKVSCSDAFIGFCSKYEMSSFLAFSSNFFIRYDGAQKTRKLQECGGEITLFAFRFQLPGDAAPFKTSQ